MVERGSGKMNRKKTLLVIGGGIQAVDGIRTARRLGLRVIVSDINPDAPGFEYADGQIIASTYDPEATVAATIQWCQHNGPIDGVLCIATDVPHTVAAVAEALQLPGIPRDVAALAVDKLAMKEKFRQDKIPIPDFHPVLSPKHIQELLDRFGGKLVLKPVDSRGGRGVLLITGDIDREWAFRKSRSQSPSGRVMAEEYIPGPQVSTETIVLDGTAHTPGFADRNYELLERYSPYFIENGGSLPSILPAAVQQKVLNLIQKAAQSLGIKNGVIKGDIVIHDGTPKIIELAARLSGGYFCTHSIPLNVGVSTVVAAIHLALGEPVHPEDLRPKYQRGVAQRYLFANPGRVIRITGLDTARNIQGIEEVIMTVRPGDIVTPPTNSSGSQGMILGTGTDRDEALSRVLAAVEAIRIETEPIGEMRISTEKSHDQEPL